MKHLINNLYFFLQIYHEEQLIDINVCKYKQTIDNNTRPESFDIRYSYGY